MSHLRIYRLACALALTLLALAYANHFRNAFQFDDDHTIQNNLYIRDVRNIPLFFKSPTTFSSLPANQSYRPLVTTTLAVDYWLGGGLDPFAFHVTSFLLFAAQCIALLFLFRRLMDRSHEHEWNRWAALVAATLYAVHAANAETVNYIIARSDILSTFGAVLAVLMFASGGAARRWHLYLIPAAAAVLAKEQGAVAAPLLFLYAALFERNLTLKDMLRPRNVLAVLRDTWPAFVVCGLLVVAGLRLATNFNPGGSRWPYLLAQPFVLLHYVFAFLLPLNLSADTDWRPIANPFDDRVLAGVVFIGLALWAAAAASRRRETRPIAFGVLWFFIALAPTSSLVPLAEVMNDHRMYFPFVGLALAATWGTALVLDTRVSPRRKRRLMPAVAVAALALLLAHAYGTRQRNVVWRTNESLWLDVTNKSPENGRGLMIYGVIQMGKGRLDVAEQYFTRALQYTPRYAYLHVNLGVLKGAQGNVAEAERHFRDAQHYDPANPVSYFYYARWLDSVGRTEEAIPMVKHALDLSPAHLEAKELLAAIESRRSATPGPSTAPRPETPEQWLELSLAQYRAARYQDCIDSSREALQLRPDYAEAYNNICAASNAMGQYQAAAEACERALAINPDYQLARNNLSLAKANLAK